MFPRVPLAQIESVLKLDRRVVTKIFEVATEAVEMYGIPPGFSDKIETVYEVVRMILTGAYRSLPDLAYDQLFDICRYTVHRLVFDHGIDVTRYWYRHR